MSGEYSLAYLRGLSVVCQSVFDWDDDGCLVGLGFEVGAGKGHIYEWCIASLCLVGLGIKGFWWHKASAGVDHYKQAQGHAGNPLACIPLARLPPNSPTSAGMTLFARRMDIFARGHSTNVPLPFPNNPTGQPVQGRPDPPDHGLLDGHDAPRRQRVHGAVCEGGHLGAHPARYHVLRGCVWCRGVGGCGGGWEVNCRSAAVHPASLCLADPSPRPCNCPSLAGQLYLVFLWAYKWIFLGRMTPKKSMQTNLWWRFRVHIWKVLQVSPARQSSLGRQIGRIFWCGWDGQGGVQGVLLHCLAGNLQLRERRPPAAQLTFSQPIPVPPHTHHLYRRTCRFTARPLTPGPALSSSTRTCVLWAPRSAGNAGWASAWWRRSLTCCRSETMCRSALPCLSCAPQVRVWVGVGGWWSAVREGWQPLGPDPLAATSPIPPHPAHQLHHPHRMQRRALHPSSSRTLAP